VNITKFLMNRWATLEDNRGLSAIQSY